MSDSDPTDQRKPGIKIPLPWGGALELRGLGTILTLTVIAQFLVAYMVYEHVTHTNINGKLLARSLQNVAVSQREFACIISKDNGPERQRAFENGSCRRLAEIGVVGDL